MDMVVFVGFIDVIIAPVFPDMIYHYCLLLLSPETQIWISIKIRTCTYPE